MTLRRKVYICFLIYGYCYFYRLQKDSLDGQVVMFTYNIAKKIKKVLTVIRFFLNILDVLDESSYDLVLTEVADTVKDCGLNVLFNNAGVAPRSTRLQSVNSKDLTDTLITNTIAPIMLTKSFVPLLRKASKFYEDRPIGCQRAAIINMSSILGSIALNDIGGMYAYRISKAGLNAATKSISIDLKSANIMCVSIHPGWVKTDMGGLKAPLKVEEASEHIVNTVYSLNQDDNGMFIQPQNKLKLDW